MTTLLIPLQEENPLLPHLSEVIAAIVFALLADLRHLQVRGAAVRGHLRRAHRCHPGWHWRRRRRLRRLPMRLCASTTSSSPRPAPKRPGFARTPRSEGTQILAELREQAQAEVARIRAQAEAQLEAERATGHDPDAS